MRQGHTPYGYRIKDGKAIICQEEADQVRRIFAGYLSGLSLKTAAEEAGVTMQHSTIKHLLQNKYYTGDDFYPAIIDQETFDSAEVERTRRERALGRDNLPKKKQCQRVPLTRFRMAKAEQVFGDPYEQAQYMYSLIESEV